MAKTKKMRLCTFILTGLILLAPIGALAAGEDTPSRFVQYAVRSGLDNVTTVVSSGFASKASEYSSELSSGAAGSGMTMVEGSTPAVIDTSNVSEGYVSVGYISSKPLKVLYYTTNPSSPVNYDMSNDGSLTRIPLTLGSGKYTIQIAENISGTRYALVATSTAQYTDAGTLNKYLQSIPTIEFNASMPCIVKAAELTASSSSTNERVTAIYNYVIANVSYDTPKSESTLTNYSPNPESTYQTRKGICYDFASLFAAMCRSQGIPCKLVKGFCTGVSGYHAWNSVYVDGAWRTVDTSSDSIYLAAKRSTPMYKTNYVVSVSSEY